MDESKLSWELIIASVLLFVGGRAAVRLCDHDINFRERDAAALVNPDASIKSTIELFGDADFARLLREQSPRERAEVVEELSRNPNAITHLSLLARHFERLSNEAKELAVAKYSKAGAELEAGPSVPTR